MQHFAKQRHALREKALLGPQPERTPRACGQKAAAVGFIRAPLPANRANVLVRSAIAILAVLRADSVTILRNLTRDPILVWERGDQVAHELRLPDTPSVPTDDNDLPPHVSYFLFRGLCALCGEFFFFVLAGMLFSNSLMRAPSSGRRAYQAYASLNLPISRAGVPQTVWPARMVLPVGIPACAPAITPSSNVQWSAIPTCPRLSSFTPSPMRVSSSEPRSMVAFAPISTSSPIWTMPACGNFQ